MIRDFRALLFFMLLVPRSWSQSAVDLAQKFPHQHAAMVAGPAQVALHCGYAQNPNCGEANRRCRLGLLPDCQSII
jgi:hypothetical protein